MTPERIIAEFDILGRYVALNLNEKPQQQALILRKLGKLFEEIFPGRRDELEYPYVREMAVSWAARGEGK